MSIEKLLEANTAALEAQTAALNANTKILAGVKGGAATTTAGKTTTTADKGPSLDDLVKKALELKSASDANVVKAIVKKVAKVDSVKLVTPEHTKAVMVAFDKKLKELAEAGDEDGETGDEDDDM